MDDTINMNMEVTLLLEDQSTLCIEVGFFDTFQEIKDKIKKYTNIPVDRQTLIFNGEILENETNMAATNIWGDSPIQLLVASDSSTRELHQMLGPTLPNQEYGPIPMPEFPPPSIHEFEDMTTPIGPVIDKYLLELDQMPFSKEELDELMELFPEMLTLGQMPTPLQITSPAPPLLVEVDTPSPPPNRNKFEDIAPPASFSKEELHELILLSQETPLPTLDQMPVANQTTSPAAPSPVEMDIMNPLVITVDTPSPPRNINEYLEDSEKFLEAMEKVKTPTKEELKELVRKYIDTPAPETTSPPQLLPRLLNLDDEEVSPQPAPPPAPPPPPQTRVELTVRIVETKSRPLKIEMDLEDTVLQLKDNIFRKKRGRTLAPKEMCVQLKSGQELHDHWTLRDCGMLTSSYVSVRKKLFKLPQPHSNSPLLPGDTLRSRLYPQQISRTSLNSYSRLHPQRISPTAHHSNSRSHPQRISPTAQHSDSRSNPQRISPVAAPDPVVGTKMMNVFVVPKGGTMKIPMQINVFNKVEKLRDELEKFHKHVVPEKGRYFFTYQKKGYVMTETYAFNWYRMEDGDVIEITPESVPDKPKRKK